MRKILSVSLPPDIADKMKERSKKRGFDSVSSYVKYLLTLDEDMISDKELMASIQQARKEYARGKTIKAKSMTDLV